MYAPLQKKEDKKSVAVQKKPQDNRQTQKASVQMKNSYDSICKTVIQFGRNKYEEGAEIKEGLKTKIASS